jgi:transcriptional regulator with XRE-family HTH domain
MPFARAVSCRPAPGSAAKFCDHAVTTAVRDFRCFPPRRPWSSARAGMRCCCVGPGTLGGVRSGHVSNTIHGMRFADAVHRARIAAGLTQAELATRCGVARPNIAAFEAGRREPRWETAVRTLGATGATIDVVEPISWTWTTGRRPYAVPSRLWRLPLKDAFRSFTTGSHLWWSGSPPLFDLADRDDRARAYELVLREGRPEDIRSIVDGALLIDTWPELVVSADLRRAWQPIIDGYRVAVTEAA